MTEEVLLALSNDACEEARKAGADAAEAMVTWERTNQAIIENDNLHTVEVSDEVVLGLRVLVGRSLGFVTANAPDSGLLARLSREAVAQARATPEDPYNELPERRSVVPVDGLYDEATAGARVEETTRAAAEILERVHAADSRVHVDSGSVCVSASTTALTSTTGVNLSQRETAATVYVFGMAVDGDDVASFDYDGDAVRRFDELENRLAVTAGRFVGKCLGGLGASKGRSFKGDVVLSPEAVGEFLVPNLVTAISADSIRKRKSMLAGKVGHEIASSSLTLVEDGTRRGGVASSAFDREGVPLERRVLVDRGVLTTYLYNHHEALAAGPGTRSTGNATGSASSLPAIGTAYLEVLPGDVPMKDIASGAQPVVWVGRFSGSSNAVTGDFSGVVKNGFLLENGMRRPIRETLIAGDLFQVLARVLAVSVERRLLEGAHLLPAVRIGGVSVTAG